MKETALVTKEASVTTRNISTVFLLKVAQYPFLVLYAVLIPRLMGPEGYGKYAVLFSLLAISASLTELGLTEICGRFIPELEARGGKPAVQRFASNVLGLKILVELGFALLLLPVLHFAYGDLFSPIEILLILAVLIVVNLGTVPYSLLFGLNELGKYALDDPLRRALSLVFTVALYSLFGFVGAVLALLVVGIIITALYFFWTRDIFGAQGLRFELSSVKPYLGFGLVFYAAWALMALWQRAGNPLIEGLTGDPRAVAMFDMANQLFLITVTFTFFVMSSLIPIFTKLLLEGKEGKLIAWSKLIAKYTGILCAVVFLSFALAGRELISVVIGAEYEAIYPNGVVLLGGAFPVILAQLGFVFSVVYRKPARYCAGLATTLAVFLAGSVLLVPRGGAMGCAIATLASCAVFALFMFVSFRDALLPCVPGLLKSLLIALAFAPLALFRADLGTNLLLVVAFITGYALALFAGGVLSAGEIKEIYRALRSRPERLAEAR